MLLLTYSGQPIPADPNVTRMERKADRLVLLFLSCGHVTYMDRWVPGLARVECIACSLPPLTARAMNLFEGLPS